MESRPYYSVRTGRHATGGRLDLAQLKRLVLSAYEELSQDGCFQEAFGYYCVDEGDVAGFAGSNIEAFFLRKLKKPGLWPIDKAISAYSEDDLFDVVELLCDCVSAGVEGQYHSWNNCGMHYTTFDRAAGQAKIRALINEILREYGPGYEINQVGEVTQLAPRGLADLEQAPPPPGDHDNVQERVAAAIGKFRRRGSTSQERRDAVRDLADVLEFLRPKAKLVLTSKDERELFELANNFGIRHHNQQQKTHYDGSIWLSWMFYYYLTTIHALTRLIEKQEREPRPALRREAND